jgi:hypothetical protein
LPYLAEWRWGLKSERTPWYPTVTLMRQPKPGDWRGLLGMVRERLEAA